MKKTIIKFGYILIISAFVIGCSSDEIDNPLYNHLQNVKDGVDIWSSINYQIITDHEMIKEIEPSSSESSFLVNILVRLENKGKLRAESIKINFVESTPIKYTNGSGHEGINHGYLDTNEEYEIYRNYLFKNQEEAEELINKSEITVEWKEKGVNRQLILKFPSQPTR